MVDILVPISFFALAYGIFRIIYTHKERMKLIDTGVDASSLLPFPKQKNNTLDPLKWGIVLICISLGFLLGNILERYKILAEEVAYFSMISLFGGLGLIIFYFVGKKANL